MYNKAIELGAKDNGKPGLRPDYHPNYYAAFFLDPDGHRIEAVCHQPEEGGKKEGKVIQEEIAEKAGEAGNELEAEAGAETEVLA